MTSFLLESSLTPIDIHLRDDHDLALPCHVAGAEAGNLTCQMTVCLKLMIFNDPLSRSLVQEEVRQILSSRLARALTIPNQ